MKIEVLGSINSGQYKIGAVIDLPKEQAERLIELGVAKSVTGKVTQKKPDLVKKPIPGTLAQTTLEELKVEADKLGLKYPKDIKKDKLFRLINKERKKTES